MGIALTNGLLTAASLLQDVTQPLSDGFMQRALLEVALVGIAAGGLGCWIVFYGLSYASESLAHSMFPGLVIAALLGVPLLAGGAVGIVVAALAIALAARAPGVERDVAVAVVVTTLFGAGVLLALSPASPPGIQSLLFGDVLATSDSNLLLAAVLAAAIIVSLRFLHGRLLAVGFDRSAARSLGASPGLADAVLLVLIAAAILVAVQGLGNLLVVAVLVGPAAARKAVDPADGTDDDLRSRDRDRHRRRRSIRLLLRGHRGRRLDRRVDSPCLPGRSHLQPRLVARRNRVRGGLRSDRWRKPRERPGPSTRLRPWRRPATAAAGRGGR